MSEAGDGWSDSRIAEALDASIRTIERTRRRGRLRSCPDAQAQSQISPAPNFRRAAEAKLIALACGPAPAGHAKWSRRLLEEKVVGLQIVESASDNTIGRMLIEDVLEIHQRPHDPKRPLVCLDETSKQLIAEKRAPLAAKPRRAARHDYEYERNGLANLFMTFAPPEGWRRVKVADRRAAVLVQDNLSTHTTASLYEAFPAAEARRIVKRFEWRYTPRHGSWLDMAASELAVLSRATRTAAICA